MQYIEKRKKLNQALRSLEKLSNVHGISIPAAALQVVKNRKQEVSDYVAANGVLPAENPAMLATQATLIHEGKIQSKIENSGISNYIEAENAVFQDEFDGSNYDNGEFDNFLEGGLLGSILSAGAAGIDAINKKRIKNNKKPILSNKFWTSLKTKVGDKVNVVRDDEGYQISIDAPKATATGEQSEIGAGISAAVKNIEKEKKKEFLRKNMPLIIGGVIALIVVIYFIARKK
jgi:hypothetical protein